jgi:hypothetical protein
MMASKIGQGGRSDMEINGGCYCGLITYEAEIDPQRVMICHCADCQTLSGSAFRSLGFTHPGSFKVLSGAPKIFIKAGDSGVGRELHFCPECGTPICSCIISDEPKVHALRVGTIRQRSELIPRIQIWHRSSQPWVAELASIPALQTQFSSDAEESELDD